MPFARHLRDIVKARAERDPAFRHELLATALRALIDDDATLAKVLLRDYIAATSGFAALAEALGRPPKALMRMLSATGNPRAELLLAIVAALMRRGGLGLSIQRR